MYLKVIRLLFSCIKFGKITYLINTLYHIHKPYFYHIIYQNIYYQSVYYEWDSIERNPSLYLQGNIRVFCRVRPLLGDELLGNDGTIPHMGFPDTDSKILELEKTSDAALNEVGSIAGHFFWSGPSL